MKQIICILLAIVVLFVSVFMCGSFYNPLYIDPISASTIGGAALGLMNYWGIAFSVNNPSAGGVESYFENQVESYVNERGGTIVDVFGAAIAVDVAGKLVIGQQTYNAIKDFVTWLGDKLGLTDSSIIMTAGGEDGVFVPTDLSSDTKLGISTNFVGYHENVSGYPYGKGYTTYYAYYGGQQIYQYIGNNTTFLTGNWELVYKNNKFYIRTELINGYSGKIYFSESAGLTLNLPNKISWDGSGYTTPDTLPDYKQWEGTVGGYSEPDTNLDQLIGGIYDGIEQGDIDLSGEVVDVPIPPTPAPTPVPIEPETPLQDVPWEGLNDLIDQTGHDITDSVGEAAGEITDALEGLRDQTEAGVGEITGSIEGVQEGVSDLTDVITEALTAPEIEEKTFDLRELFPFCIPFDIYHLLQKFDGTPAAPHVQLPIVIPSIGFSYTLDLDFSVWDPVAATMRAVELIAYALGLAWATSKVIKW